MKDQSLFRGFGVQALRRQLGLNIMLKQVTYISGAPGIGKCLGRGTPVLMADGRVRPVEDVRVGDHLASPTGGARIVQSVVSGEDDLFRVTPVKGDPYIVNAPHLLSLQVSGMDANSTLPLADGTRINCGDSRVTVRADVFAASSEHTRYHLKGWRAPVASFDGEVCDLPVPPYILGLWLGDGSMGVPEITKPAGPVTDAWAEWGRQLGCSMTEYKCVDRCPRWHLTGPRGKGNTNPATALLRVAGVLDHKHVPHDYLTSSTENRMALLAGLLDTDGSLVGRDTGFEFSSKWEHLAMSVAFLARSVGLAAYVRPKRVRIPSTGIMNTYWVVLLSGDCSILPTRQKIATPRTQIKRVDVTGIRVEPIGRGEYFGFELDGDRLFMLGDFTVTHNTRIVEQCAEDAGFAPITFIISQMMPEDLGGMVAADLERRTSIRLKPDVLDRIEQTRESTGKPVLAFFDEINNGSAMMFGALMNLLLERCAAGFCVPEDTVFVAAGNPPEVSAVAQDLPAPLINRMAMIQFAGPTSDEFETYGLQRRFHPSVLGFLKLDSNVSYLKDEADFNSNQANPTPRSWESVSDFLKVFDTARANGQVTVKDRMLGIAARVGDRAAQMMEVALKYGDELTPWSEIIKDPHNAPTPEQFVPAFMQTMTLVNCVETVKDFDTAFTYLKRMPKEMRGVFAQGMSKSPHFDTFYPAIEANPEIAKLLGRAGQTGASLALK